MNTLKQVVASVCIAGGMLAALSCENLQSMLSSEPPLTGADDVQTGIVVIIGEPRNWRTDEYELNNLGYPAPAAVERMNSRC